MISLLVINFRASALAVNAIRTAREATSAPLDVVVVDNSLDSAEADGLRDYADTLIVSTANRGYAGGINDGMRACRGDRIVISNPDVLFAADAVDRLCAELDNAAVSGPALYWDDALRWHLPPGDLATGREMLDTILAARSHEWRAQWDSRRIRKRIRHWQLSRTTRVSMLSGAVLAVRRDAFERAGGFDERFALYFEENDFLRRIADRRMTIVHVPSAKCRHIYDQSASQVAEEAATRFAESQRRYLEKWNGPFAASAMLRFQRPLPPLAPQAHDPSLPIATSPGMLIEASPLPTFATAAGWFATEERVVLPPEILASLRGDLYLREVDPRRAHPSPPYKITA
jgi:N-acetylglucosaminyl-diphospho-decaprenol L-rhamnosyltransferase